ncbi:MULTISPECIES: RHS repeat-associated core domain-containing protein [unclassified Pseudomonas]|uniref:RHS repeat-associated core domain-containing protein n=1 Tax=unclassified Pseudomonas TaxID=196821 RepID=UPI00257F20F1|nr:MULTISPECIES: RHS repeat-associated core domain-containing protein [unclassified Pseudomonas]
MGRYSEKKVTGYNKSILEKAGLKLGEKIEVNGRSVWLIGIEDSHINVNYNRKDSPNHVRIYYEESGGNHCASIEGVPPEEITLLSQNKEKYEALESKFKYALQEITSLGAQKLNLKETPVFPRRPLIALIELKDDYDGSNQGESALYSSAAKNLCGFLCIVEASELAERSDELIISTHVSLNDECFRSGPWNTHFTLPPSRELGCISKDRIRALYDLSALDKVKPVLDAINAKTQALSNLVENDAKRTEFIPSPFYEDLPSGLVIVDFNHAIDETGRTSGYGLLAASGFRVLTISCPEETVSEYNALKSEHEFLSYFEPLKDFNSVEFSIKAFYATSGMTAEQPNDDSTSTTGPSPTARPLQSLSTPYLISNQADGSLPDMTDFSLERAGSIEGGWCTSTTIKAGRALAEGEVLSAFLIDRLDGDIRKVDYTAQKGELSAQQWPKAFADYLAAAGEPMTAGGWGADNTFSTASEPLRLWSPARYRTFSNAPFAANLVQALACDESFTPTADETLCLQVRDLTSQALYEHHFFTPTATQASAKWSKALCEQINRDSRLMRAGVPDDCSVTPAESGNAFWVPQCAELCVTLTETRWWQSQAIESEQALGEGQTLQAWVYDAFSHRLLAHHTWTADKAQRSAGKWLGAWAKALNASPVAAYLRVATHNPQAERADEADNLHLWQRGDALRIFTTLPDAANRLPGPTLQSAWKADAEHAVLVTVRHPFSRKLLHRALFKPQDADNVNDRDTWLQALGDFLKAQAWPEVHIGASDEPLCVPRFSELQVLLENVGDGNTWSDGDYVNYLLETDQLPGSTAAEQARFKVTAGAATVQVEVESLNGELAFRLDKAAHEKGYRVAACVPRASEQPRWPVEVTDTKVTWAGPIVNGVYDLYLTYPEKARDETTLTVGHIGAFHSSHFWHGVQAVEFTPHAAMKAYEEISFLCEDYGNTNHSEVFDTSNQDQTGVDERSGLFHAHYPIATLQGLHGLGPVCDLTLHYSALRANEAGLGDGWAWRFSRIITSSTQENDHRLLTLADGTPVTFSDEQWTQLGAGQAIKTNACRVTSNKDYSQFKLEFPSGRQEVLSKPAAPGSDEVEPNDEFRKKVLKALKAIKNKSKPAFPTMPAHWTQWVLLVLCPHGYYTAGAIDYSEAVSLWSKHGNTKELDRRIALYERPFVQLLPSRIVSQYGEALDLQWKRQKGQFLLMSIKSGKTELFSAEYVDPEVKAGGRVNMQLWPGSNETFKVELTLEHYLLRTLKRLQKDTVVQQVDCGYDDDPTLDRVLCRLQELDGSVECVQYVKQDAKLKGAPALPRVALHALLPGGGQQNHIHHYTYTGSYQNPDDQLFIAAVQRGAHANVVHDLHTFGLDAEGNRTPLMRGSGSANAHWLEFYLRHEHTTTTFRYTGLGDELVEIIERMVIRVSGTQIEVTAKAPAIERRQAVLQALWGYSTKNRRQLHQAIKHMLSLAPKAQRANLGKTVDATTIVTDAKGNPLHLHAKGSHSVYYCYYGDQTENQIALGSVKTLSAVPTLECPFVPDYASAPLMAEYQCDDYGNPQGLKLYGYRKVTRADRDYLELADVVMVDGIRGTLTNDTLDKDTTWALIGNEALWHQITTSTSVPASKKTTSEQSKVLEWAITSKQTTHQDGKTLELTNVQKFIDNPTQPGIQVIVSATTPAGTAQVSKEVRSRYSRRALQKVEKGIEAHWERDAAGRITKETRYLLASGSTGKTTKQIADESIDSVYSADGREVERTYKDGSQSHSSLDGLQRAWQTSWRRSVTETYVPLEAHCFTGLDESCVLGSWVWDYLPGGQAVRKDMPLRGLAGRQPWLAQEAKTVASVPVAVEEDRHILARLNSSESNTLEITLNALEDAKVKELIKKIDHHTNICITLSGKDYTVCNSPQSIIVTTHVKSLKVMSVIELFKSEKFDALAQLAYQNGDSTLDILELFAGCEVSTIRTEASKNPSDDEWYDSPVITKEGINLSPQIADLKLRCAENLPIHKLSNTADSVVQITEQQGLSTQCLSKRTTTRTAKADGTLQHSVQWADESGVQHLQLDQHYDSDGRITRHARTVGENTRAYALEHDSLGRVTKVTRPDATTIERTYHGFSNHVSSLTVDGQVVATQAVSELGKLSTRKIGSREYGFAEQSVTLPDKTQLRSVQDASGMRLEADGNALYSQKHPDGSTVLNSDAGWRHSIASAQVPGRRNTTEKTPRGTVKGAEWQSLRGQSIAARHANGRTRRVFHDSEGRLLRSCQQHEDVLYRYDELGHLQTRRVQALTGAGQWQVHSERDGLNRETVRTFLRNGAPCFSQHMTWQGDGRLASKASYQNGNLLRTERFTYDLLDRLASYACDTQQAAHCPQNGDGTPIKAQTFSWDSLDNLTRCTSTPFEGEAVTETFTYATTSDPTRLTSMKTGEQATALTWNSNGQLQVDGLQRTRTYTAAGQLSSIKDDTGTLLTRYEYDGLQRLAAQYEEKDQSTRELRYDGDELIGQVCFDKAGKPTRRTSISPGLAQYDGDQVRWLIDDPQVGIVGQVCDDDLQLAPLLPFGEGATLEGLVTGYNGMRRDPVTGQYHAGNGYRCYDPALRRHTQPDWLSPFGEGGINDYAHCPDPVNLHDPSGAIMLSRWGQKEDLEHYEQILRETKPMPVGGRWRGLALSATLTVLGIAASVMTGGAASVFFVAMTTCAVLSFGFEVASVLTEDSNPELSRKLGYAALAFGVASLAESALGLLKKLPALAKAAMSSVRQVGKRLTHFKAGTRLARNTVSPMEYAMEQLGSIPGVTPAIGPARNGVRATLRVAGTRLINYLGEAQSIDLNAARYARMGAYGRALRKAHRLHNFATRSRALSAGAWVTGKAIETHITQSSVFSFIAIATGDSSSAISPWGRYSIPLDQSITWNHGGGGHLLA